MEGNEWIIGYLEAILDSGHAIEELKVYQYHHHYDDSGSREMVGFNATKYFVEEVVSGFDETDIHRTWMRATATKNAKERTARLENLCWRIWNITRKKRQIESADAQRLAHRYLEREQGRKDTTEDMPEDVGDGDKADGSEAGSIVTPRRNFSDLEAWINLQKVSDQQHKEKRLYIVLISLHGLVRGENMELGRDADTGGQVKYVVEFARALARMPEVYRVDLLTRQISDPLVDSSYGEPTEMLMSGSYGCCGEEIGESSGAYIVRIPCGPRDKYLRKELLWPYIQEFVDGALTHILNMSKVLGDQIAGGELVWPHVIHGHYADAGYAAALLSGSINVPMVLTGHSLGRNKLEQLLKQGRQSKDDINATYRILRRIEAEELSIDASEVVITSTRQEIEEQWGLYDGFNLRLYRTLRARSRNGLSSRDRYMPRMVVIPPGMDFSNVVQDVEVTDVEGDDIPPTSSHAEPPIWGEIMRFFANPHKPMILALARPDPKKNFATLVQAFGECRALRDLANLTLVMGNRDDIDSMPAGSAGVCIAVLSLVDKYDLYGQVAYPKHHRQSDVPDIYRLAAKTKGVFINPALVEPFGLTLIEAAAHGLPTVATTNGGPVDIERTLRNGLLIDPHDVKDIANALLKLLADRNQWLEKRRNGLQNIHLYSWPEHCKSYLSKLSSCRARQPQWQNISDGSILDESLEGSLTDMQDISLRLSDDGDQLKQVLEKHQRKENLSNGHSTNLCNAPSTKLCNGHSTSSNGASIQSSANLTNKTLLRRRKKLFVIAVDEYETSNSKLQDVLKAVKSQFAGRTAGLVLTTSLTVNEVVDMLSARGLSVNDFDALICSSGSELYYMVTPSSSDDVTNGSCLNLIPDSDYQSHIDYRWGFEVTKEAISRLISLENGSVQDEGELFLVPDEQRSNSHCIAYTVNKEPKVLKVDEFRRKFRMRGLRCHVVYCDGGRKLHVLPLLASRAQALRYLFVRWGVDIANMCVCVGETGDSDYEELLGGTQRTVILKGAVQSSSEHLLRTTGSYGRDDVVPSDYKPNMMSVDTGNPEALIDAIRK